MSQGVRPRLRIVLIGIAFCLSGVSALVYQVAWQRILALHSGVGIYSIAVIVAAFMAGLGIGSYAGGAASARISAARSLRVFALLELGIGAFAALSCTLYYDVLYLNGARFYSTLWSSAIAHFGALAIPTCLMGMSLPFLVRATVLQADTACRTIGYLYGINVVGAALGALLTPWILIRFLGIEGAVYVGAAGNLAAGLSALVLGRGASEVEPEEAEGGAAPDPVVRGADGAERPATHPFGLWIGLYALSGFCALALEILWFRLMDVAVKSNAFTFGSMLAIFLFGLAAGCLFGGPYAVRVKRPLASFLRIQALLAIWTGLAVVWLVRAPTDWPITRDLWAYWEGLNEFPVKGVWDWGLFATLYLLLPALLYALPTVLMGLSFAVLQRAVHDDRQTSGRKVGFLQTGNIVGSVAGSLAMGLVFLRVLGTAGSLRLVLALGLFFPLLGLRAYRRPSFGVLGAVLAATILLLPGDDELWTRLHAAIPGRAWFDEDASGVVAVLHQPGPDEREASVAINGKSHSWFPFGGLHSQLGAAGAILHPAPESVAIIGLGSGDTAWAAGCREETRRIEVFELCAPEVRLLRSVVDEPFAGALGSFLDDPRLRIRTTDGRNALARTEDRFDLIEADALRPQSAYAGNLYSVEFFRMCASRLRPGGVMCQWAPTKRIMLSFTRVFPHVLWFREGPVLVGSNEPLTIDLERWRAWLGSERALDYLGERVARDVWRNLQTVRRLPNVAMGFEPNHDLFPRDEFRTPLPKEAREPSRPGS